MATVNSLLHSYEFLEYIGGGSFGQVHRACHKATGRVVAIKTMKKWPRQSDNPEEQQKNSHLSECIQLREYNTLKQLSPQANIVEMYDGFVCQSAQQLCIVMEYVNGGNLYQFMGERREADRALTHAEVRSFLRQILHAVEHIHKEGIFHRDLKPENLFVDKTSENNPVIKLGDFGLAREVNGSPPYTEYVSTRWYRAPEVLLRSNSYSSPVDLWAVGTIFAEMITLQPLFPGQSEIDQLYLICEILGSPGNKPLIRRANGKPEKRHSPGFARKAALANADSASSSPAFGEGGGEWREGVKLAHKIGFSFPQLTPKPLASVIPTASDSMLNLLQQFLYYMPSRRITASEALQHPFLTEDQFPNHATRTRHLNAVPRELAKKPRTTCNDTFSTPNALRTAQASSTVCPERETKLNQPIEPQPITTVRQTTLEPCTALASEHGYTVHDEPPLIDLVSTIDIKPPPANLSEELFDMDFSENSIPWKPLRPTKIARQSALVKTHMFAPNPVSSSTKDHLMMDTKPKAKQHTDVAVYSIAKQHRDDWPPFSIDNIAQYGKRLNTWVPPIRGLAPTGEPSRKHPTSVKQRNRVIRHVTDTNVSHNDEETINEHTGWAWLKVL